MTELVPAVAEAVDAVRIHFAGHPVEVTSDGAGGATVVIDGVDVGPRYTPSTTWLGFHVSSAYPAADVYPHRVGLLQRVDGRPHGPAIQVVPWEGRPSLQISRRSTRWNPTVDSAANKAERILTWLAAQ